MKLKLGIAALGLMLLAGCNNLSRTDYEKMRYALGNTKIRNAVVANCTQRMSHAPRHKVELAATILNIPERSFSKTFCTRFVNGIRSGRISYEDLKRGPKSVDTIRALQGRR